MSNIAIQKIEDTAQRNLPVFDEIGKRLEEIRKRALSLFEKRGRQFGHALDDWLGAEREILGKWSAAELKDKAGMYELDITLPGYDPKEVQITATPAEIIVHAESKHEKESTNGNVVWTEFGSNNVYRRIEFPHPIDVEKIQAKLEKGMLHVAAPKAAVAQAKSIEIAS